MINTVLASDAASEVVNEVTTETDVQNGGSLLMDLIGFDATFTLFLAALGILGVYAGYNMIVGYPNAINNR